MARLKNLRKRNFAMQLRGQNGPVRVIGHVPATGTAPVKPYRIDRKSLPPGFPVRKHFSPGWAFPERKD